MARRQRLFLAGGLTPRLRARLGDGHTSLSLHPQVQGYRYFPLQLFWFSDGIHATAAASDRKRAVPICFL